MRLYYFFCVTNFMTQITFILFTFQRAFEPKARLGLPKGTPGPAFGGPQESRTPHLFIANEVL